MASTELIVVRELQSTGSSAGPRENLNELARLATLTLASEATRRVYAARLRAYLESTLSLSREGVAEYLAQLRTAGARASTINQTLSAIKILAEEAQTRGLLSYSDCHAITSLRQDKHRGIRLGNWLDIDHVKFLLALPDQATTEGKRDMAVLVLLLGSGLRRQEAASLIWSQYQKRNDRMVWADVAGKGGKIRTIPIPLWAQKPLDMWKAAVWALYKTPLGSAGKPQDESEGAGKGFDATSVLRTLTRGGKIAGPLTASGVWWVVRQYGEKLGVQFNPHDARRTLARLMRQGGAAIEQIQYTLGHASVKTTEIYLGGAMELELGKAAVDQVEL